MDDRLSATFVVCSNQGLKHQNLVYVASNPVVAGARARGIGTVPTIIPFMSAEGSCPHVLPHPRGPGFVPVRPQGIST